MHYFIKPGQELTPFTFQHIALSLYTMILSYTKIQI